MKDLIRQLLLLEIENYLVDIVAVDKSNLRVKTSKNGNITSFGLYDTTSLLGTLRVFDYENNYKVKSVSVSPLYRGQGLGFGLYLHVIKKIKNEGRILYSDNNQEPYARKIWEKLVAKGLAEKVTECVGFKCLFRTL